MGRISGLGPYAPMGSGINIGEPLDASRRNLQNPDGSFSTEKTITLQLGDRWYNVPTIVDGKEYPASSIEQAFFMGLVPHVGEFGTVEEAERSAAARSAYIGKRRM